MTEHESERNLPPLGTQAKNFAKAVFRNIGTGFQHAEQEEQDDRRSICESNVCGNYRPSDDRCADCGCFLAEKIPLIAETCPLMLWPGDELKTTGDKDG